MRRQVQQFNNSVLDNNLTMQQFNNYYLPFLLTLFISIIFTGALRKIGIHYKIVSVPRKRDIHKKPIPRIGGVAIFLSFMIVSYVVFKYILPEYSVSSGSDWLGINKHIIGMWIGGAIIAFSMLIDDIYGLKAWQKIIFQIISTLVIIGAGIGLNFLPNPFGQPINLNSVYIPILNWHGITYHFSLWSDLLTLVWIIGMMNIINFVDGVDGLAGGVSTIAAATIFLLSISVGVNQPQTAMIAIILAGATLGFLVWNFPPAKIFMGDAGSMFLGFMLGTLTLVSGGKLATVFLVLGFPIIDGVLVVGGRLRRGENPFTTPDKTHLHHRFLKAGYSSRQSIVCLYAISILFAWVALRSSTENKIMAAIALVLAVFALTRWLNLKIKKLT